MKQVLILIAFILAFGIFSSAGQAEPLGNTYVAGTSWFDFQHNGSCGRMVGVDDSDFVHAAWMSLPTANPDISRHIRYNLWDPATQAFEYPGGMPMDSNRNGGYVTLAVTPDGCPLFGYHEWRTDYQAQQSCVNVCGEQSVFPPPIWTQGQVVDIIWPQITRSVNGTIHLVSEENNAIGMYENRVYYSRGIVHTDSEGVISVVWRDYEGTGFDMVGWTCNVAHTIASSRYSGRVARAWLQSRRPFPTNTGTQYDNDVIVQISDDDGLTWNPPINITSFIPGDTACYNQTQNWQVCSRDTFRAFQEINLLFDEADVLHVAFTTIGYYTWNENGEESITWRKSLIWHWSEATGQFSLIADGWFNSTDPAAYQRNVNKPSLAMDAANGTLHCAYIQYDPNLLSEGGYLNADVWISASTDGGSNWSVGTNVTRTTPAVIPTPAGECLVERDPTLAETTSDGILHLTYALDRDAGLGWYDEGVYTLNDFIYQRVPADSIALAPLLRRYPLHYDSSGFAHAESFPVSAPRSMILHPAYPNPFNSGTTIIFELPYRGDITLSVFDILGREVQTLLAGNSEAGVHSVAWDASRFASGLYFVQLRSAQKNLVTKVMLLK